MPQIMSAQDLTWSSDDADPAVPMQTAVSPAKPSDKGRKKRIQEPDQVDEMDKQPHSAKRPLPRPRKPRQKL